MSSPVDKPLPRAAVHPLSPGKLLSLEEFLEFERQANEEKHEFRDGKTFAMAGASHEHNLLVSNIVHLLVAALRGCGCPTYPSDMKVKIKATDSIRYPDVSALCGRPEFHDKEKHVLTNPMVIFEVLSDGTEDFDRGGKFEEYKSIASLREYVLVSQHEVMVERFVRQADGSWTRTEHRAGDHCELPSLKCKLAVDEVYLDVFNA